MRLIIIPSDTPASLNKLSQRKYPFTSYEYLYVQPATESKARLHLERAGLGTKLPRREQSKQ